MFSGFDVPHCHYHLVPAHGGDDLNFSHAKPAIPEELKEIQEKIISKLKTNR